MPCHLKDNASTKLSMHKIIMMGEEQASVMQLKSSGQRKFHKCDDSMRYILMFLDFT